MVKKFVLQEKKRKIRHISHKSFITKHGLICYKVLYIIQTDLIQETYNNRNKVSKLDCIF